ncbi:DUF177 domain-containing protein [Helicobacter cetorum]|uniref:DUF177 domain-containing protein n=1 Tax=Helicobacter cetorum (strain ATCC BAA-540 / CCUG 52418 / MIT 99-5656) TaxID=1163745 RepID=I0EQ67_HELCM|nr:hypothetical protein [Helicobacter cetorum]AFI05086.1 hypothetical protein HCD_00270 [Helicobacter cetorum MIT 99-5656]
MKLEMRKIASNVPKKISLEYEGVSLEGEVVRLNGKIFRLNARIKGELMLVCSLSGKEFKRQIDEPLVLHVSDGVWDMQSQSLGFDNLDVIESFNGFIDLSEILRSEVESIKLDYHYTD